MGQFIHSDLGFRQSGEIVEVLLTSGANVRLLDGLNFSSYRTGAAYRYHGGLARQSPVHLRARFDSSVGRGNIRRIGILTGRSCSPCRRAKAMSWATYGHACPTMQHACYACASGTPG